MIKKRMHIILNPVNKKPSKTLMLVLVLTILTTSLFVGCNTSENPETSSDLLYQHKTPYIGNNSKVVNIVSNLDFSEGYHYHSISLSRTPSTNSLNILLTADTQTGFTAEKFNVQSAMLFSLIDNLDEIVYVRVDKEGHPKNIKPIDRKSIDDMTISIFGMKTNELGSSKDNFQNLSDLYGGSVSESASLAGYIFFENNTLYLDEVEIITLEDTDRIKELNLIPAADLPNGYYIHNPDLDVFPFELTNHTTYIFTDYDLIFVKEANSPRIYETTKQEEFLEASSYENISLEEQRIPYFLQIYEDKVIRITEKFIYTQ